tara:strand:+ start:9565 stop:9837 length:273 start_codon:yes stop_codon:yes gene_type:complete
MSQEPYVPIESVAKHFSVSISTIRAWVRQSYIPQETYIKVGSTYRFRVSDVAEALKSVDMHSPEELMDSISEDIEQEEAQEEQLEFDFDR